MIEHYIKRRWNCISDRIEVLKTRAHTFFNKHLSLTKYSWNLIPADYPWNIPLTFSSVINRDPGGRFLLAKNLGSLQWSISISSDPRAPRMDHCGSFFPPTRAPILLRKCMCMCIDELGVMMVQPVYLSSFDLIRQWHCLILIFILRMFSVLHLPQRFFMFEVWRNMLC